jgi:hypothetical protein
MLLALLLVQDKEVQARAMVDQLDQAIVLYVEQNGKFPPTLETLIDPVPKDPWGNAFVYRIEGEEFKLGYAERTVGRALKGILRRSRTDRGRVAARVGAATAAFRAVNGRMPKSVDELTRSPVVILKADQIGKAKLEFLEERVRISMPTAAVEPLSEDKKTALDGHLRDLSAEEFEKREAAVANIAALGPAALPPIRAAFEKSGDLEVRARLDPVIKQLEAARLRAEAPAVFVMYCHARPAGDVLSGARIKSNERNASASLKSCVTAQENFKGNDLDRNNVGDYWTGDVAGLYCLQVVATGNAIAALNDIGVASADPSQSDAGFANAQVTYNAALLLTFSPKSGYLYRAMVTDAAGTAYAQNTGDGFRVHRFDAYAFTAYPNKVGTSGRNTYIVNEAGVVYRRDTGGQSVLEWPGDEELAAEWEKVE